MKVRNFSRGNRWREDYLLKNQTINRILPRLFSGKVFGGNRWAFLNPFLPYQVGLPPFFARFCSPKYKTASCCKKLTVLQFDTMKPDLRVLFLGTPEFAVPPLEELVQEHWSVVAVYTRPDKPGGRGRSLVMSPVKMAALGSGLPVVQPESLKGKAAVEQLAGFKPDVLVVAAFGQILPQAVLDIPQHGCLNIHPSLLPRYRGASPVAAAILGGEETTGVTFMLMDSGLDTGPILAQEKMTISPQDTTGSLSVKLSHLAAQLLPDVLHRWTEGEIIPRPQTETGATYSATIKKEDGAIDWQLPAGDIWQRVRAFQPWPGAYTSWDGRRLEIIEAVALPGQGKGRAGEVAALGREGAAFGVSTGHGILGVITLQLQGKRAMPAADFLRGQRRFIGAVLPN
jgi:methionyl-tRNA formyltransferase